MVKDLQLFGQKGHEMCHDVGKDCGHNVTPPSKFDGEAVKDVPCVRRLPSKLTLPSKCDTLPSNFDGEKVKMHHYSVKIDTLCFNYYFNSVKIDILSCGTKVEGRASIRDQGPTHVHIIQLSQPWTGALSISQCITLAPLPGQ